MNDVQKPNALWCADYKGEFKLGNKRYCYPLTITDYSTRYLLACDALDSTKEDYAFTSFERTFQEFGMLHAIRTDNGIPFSSRTAFFGLSHLAVWWLRLGIAIERIKPGTRFTIEPSESLIVAAYVKPGPLVELGIPSSLLPGRCRFESGPVFNKLGRRPPVQRSVWTDRVVFV